MTSTAERGFLYKSFLPKRYKFLTEFAIYPLGTICPWHDMSLSGRYGIYIISNTSKASIYRVERSETYRVAKQHIALKYRKDIDPSTMLRMTK